MFILRFIPIFFLFFLFSIISLHAQTAQEYYKQGVELKKQNKIDEAIEALKKAVEKDRKFTEAYYELALAYQLKKTYGSLKRAEDMILAAKKHGDDDVKYLIALALIYEDRLMFPEAKYTWERVQKIDPDNPEAYAGIARYYANEVERYKYRVDKGPLADYFYDENLSRYYDTYYVPHPGEPIFRLKDIKLKKQFEITPPIRWDDYVAEDESLAVEYNKKVIENDPYNRYAVYRIGKIYYTKVKYLSAYETKTLYDGYRDDRSHLDKFVNIFEDLIERYPDDKDGNLFLGLGYFRLKDYEKAYLHFDKAKSLMSDEEVALFTNIGYLKVGAIAQEEFHSFESDTAGFFYRRDPLFLTPYNERELEHYCRVAEANLLFSNPNKDIEGWKTEQGKILIKYGSPKNRVKANNVDALLVPLSRLLGQGILIQKFLDARGLSFDFWYYDDFTFVFSKGFYSPDYNYKLTVWNGMNLYEIAQDEEEKYPEYYEYEPKGLFIDFPFDVATFRGDEGRTRMELYYGVPFNKVRFEAEGEYYYSNYQTGVFLHDWDWNRVLEDVQYKDLQFAVVEIDTSSDDIAVDRFTYQVEPDSYHFAVEMQDMYSDNVGTYRDTLNVEEYGYGPLKISDIQLASHITLIDSTGPVTRQNLEITPNPPRFYRANQSIYIYYEIYNLFLTDLPGNTDYTVEYNMDYIGEEKYTIADFVRRLIVNEKQVLGVSTIFTRSGREKDESSFLRIDHTLTKEGPYELTLKVTDNIAHKTVEKSVVLRLFENK